MNDDATIASLRRALAAAHGERAMIYARMYETLARRLGDADAATVMREALRARGREIGQRMRRPDIDGFLDAFAGEPAEAPLWDMALPRCDAGGAEVRMGRCPLKEAWLAAGLAPERVASLCHVASALDEGTFEAAGFGYEIDTWQPGDAGCCRITLRAAS